MRKTDVENVITEIRLFLIDGKDSDTKLMTDK